jgi:hypothetical protein
MLTQREALENFGFSSVLTILGYHKSNAEWCQAENLPKGVNFAFKITPKMTPKTWKRQHSN